MDLNGKKRDQEGHYSRAGKTVSAISEPRVYRRRGKGRGERGGILEGEDIGLSHRRRREKWGGERGGAGKHPLSYSTRGRDALDVKGKKEGTAEHQRFLGEGTGQGGKKGRT